MESLLCVPKPPKGLRGPLGYLFACRNLSHSKSFAQLSVLEWNCLQLTGTLMEPCHGYEYIRLRVHVVMTRALGSHPGNFLFQPQ